MVYVMLLVSGRIGTRPLQTSKYKALIIQFASYHSFNLLINDTIYKLPLILSGWINIEIEGKMRKEIVGGGI